MNKKGFTLLELLAILLIGAILAVVILPRFYSPSIFAARSFYDQTLAMMRYGQKIAMAQRANVQIRIESSRGLVCLKYGDVNVDLSCASSHNNVLNPANSDPFQLTVPRDIYVHLNDTNDIAFSFNGLGKPNDPASVHVVGDGMTRTIKIERETGYVH